MATMDQESLFSLEVVVNTLTLEPKEQCRYPAVAFRLLDFPTLLIHHVEPELGLKIKHTIKKDPVYKLPKQFPELQDKTGIFQVKKGKSCLFKVSPNILQSHLENTPLYVMLIDTYPEVPKLVGSCTIPLDECMNDLSDDISQSGVSIPHTATEKGTYTLCNLMGKQIGDVVVCLRLVSLGQALLNHLPDNFVAKLKKQVTYNVEGKREDGTDQPVVIYELEKPETFDKPIQVSREPEPKQISHFQVQTEQEELVNTGTQTFKKKSVKLARKPRVVAPEVQDEMDDFLVTNVISPPNLFYNSEMDLPTAPGLLLSHYAGQPSKPQDPAYSDSDNDTIRSEDTFSDSDDGHKVNTMFKPVRRIDPIRKTLEPVRKPPAPQRPPGWSNLPILNALLQEISALQNSDTKPPGQLEILKAMTQKSKPHQDRSPSRQTPRKETPRQTSIPESKDEFLSRMSSPRRVPEGKPKPRPSSPPGTRRHTCAASKPEPPPTQQPTVNKGWLRHQPSLGLKKNALQYGMTQTQRLRLAKGNPQLLISLEQEEEQRLQKRRDQMLKKWGTQLSTGTADLSTEISKHQFQDTDPRRFVPRLQLGESLESARQQKKPVPTPRMSISTKDLEDALEEEELGSPPPPITPRKSKQKKLFEDLVSEQESGSVSESHRTDIEVFMPSTSAHGHADDASDATSVYDSDDGSEVFGRTQIISRQKPDMTEDVIDTETQGISAAEVLGLKCIVDRFSDDEDDTSTKLSSQSLISNPQVHSKLHISQIPNPTASSISPNVIDTPPKLSHIMATRQPFSTHSSPDGLSGTQDSTAYITKSQVRAQVSVDSSFSTVSRGDLQRPSPSPRLSQRNRSQSATADSLSSYAPSDLENMSPRSQLSTHREYDEYSDSFEDASEGY